MPSTDSSKAARRHSWYGLFSLKRTASHLVGSVEHNSDQHHSHHHSHHSHKLHSHSHGRGKEDRFYVLHTDSHRDLKMVVPAERNAHASNSPSASHGLRVIHNEKANTSDPLSAREFARRKLESQEIQNMKAARLINSRGSGSPESARYRSFSVADSTISGISERPRYSHFHNESIQSDISMRTLDRSPSSAPFLISFLLLLPCSSYTPPAHFSYPGFCKYSLAVSISI